MQEAAVEAGEVTPAVSETAASEQQGSAAAAAHAAAAASGGPATQGVVATPPEPTQADAGTPTGVKALTGGAADLKAILGSAREGGATVVLLWHSSSDAPAGSTETDAATGQASSSAPGASQAASQLAGGQLGELLQEAERLSLEQPELRVFLADVGASKANG